MQLIECSCPNYGSVTIYGKCFVMKLPIINAQIWLLPEPRDLACASFVDVSMLHFIHSQITFIVSTLFSYSIDMCFGNVMYAYKYIKYLYVYMYFISMYIVNILGKTLFQNSRMVIICY